MVSQVMVLENLYKMPPLYDKKINTVPTMKECVV